MNVVAGVDGCKAGWLCITRAEAGSIASVVFRTAASLLEQPYDLIAIDIPIGLPDSGRRTCDVTARKMLGRRGCCVFPAPIRPLLAATSQPEASAVRRRLEGKGVSAQVWGIVSKIREVDQILAETPSLRQRVRETHPEVSFMAWNRGVPIVERKKSSAGKASRRALVSSRFGGEAYERIRRRHPRSEVADDDINDGFAALWTAERIAGGTAVAIPGQIEPDAGGVRMEIWY